MTGRIVCSKAGRDKGRFSVIVGQENGCIFVCDGKEHPLERPKKKNRKHLALTNTYLKDEDFRSNRALRTALDAFRTGECKEE